MAPFKANRADQTYHLQVRLSEVGKFQQDTLVEDFCTAYENFWFCSLETREDLSALR